MLRWMEHFLSSIQLIDWLILIEKIHLDRWFSSIRLSIGIFANYFTKTYAVNDHHMVLDLFSKNNWFWQWLLTENRKNWYFFTFISISKWDMKWIFMFWIMIICFVHMMMIMMDMRDIISIMIMFYLANHMHNIDN